MELPSSVHQPLKVMIKLPLLGPAQEGPGGIKKCGRGEKHVGETVLFVGHDCLLYLISTGRDPR